MNIKIKKLIIGLLIITLVSPLAVLMLNGTFIRTYAEDPRPKSDFYAYYNISESQRDYIKDLIEMGYPLEKIQVGYAFIYDRFGKLEHLKSILEKESQGESWASVFEAYDLTYGIFQPTSFDSDSLDTLMQSHLSSDEIMIIDRIAFASEEAFDVLMIQVMEGTSFEEIIDALELVGHIKLYPRVQVTEEVLNHYQNQYALEDMQIIEAMVIAEKLDLNEKNILESTAQGMTEYEILGYYLQEIFE
ncbi:hypothetical protein EDC19_1385 [Natranaerovirga hydrolytica]|uniref:Uncharacterized protein n=1 Tax=Natranaerovirga hydrolytica TaxID=680378 RepID=A0A4R1MKE0_9FIRM|nr:hypothetical protein [Natranaerovirga hydrolytica]TCK93196.1 hypothetical protein EDC19_1385 [Natranaerovirga hydrolytica]